MPINPPGIDRLGGAARVRLGVEILTAYVRVRRLLRSHEPAVAIAMLRQQAKRETAPSEPDTQLILGWRLAHAVNVALTPLPTDVRCLSRSLTLLAIMERRGLQPKLIISVRPQPFSAHAWIEFHGQPLLPDLGSDHERLAEL
jgi:hypothetical protein